MGRSHHFHLDIGGHSVTVNVGPGRNGEIELLVNGKVVSYQAEHAAGPNVLTGELPDDPPRPFRVRLRQSRLFPGPVRCTLKLDGKTLRMPERTPV